ncbi:MAG: prepilin-type N-terminal cleavage/methylation domain-containing protein [Planctomycetota bacterium]
MRRIVPPRPNSPGFTLFEMLLVLALLVSLLAVTFPTLGRLQVEYQLKQGAELVRLQVTSARLHALESGIDYQFRYEPGGKHFLAVPADYQAVQAQATAAKNNPSGAATAGYWKTQGEFQVKVKFSADTSKLLNSQSQAQAPQPLPPEFLAGFENSGVLTSVVWSPPLIFKPDGSAQDFAVEIENEAGAYVTLEVRGITGGTHLSQLLRRVRN